MKLSRKNCYILANAMRTFLRIPQYNLILTVQVRPISSPHLPCRILTPIPILVLQGMRSSFYVYFTRALQSIIQR